METSTTRGFDTISVGIGAGQHCDGQILVIDDLLGLYSNFTPKFVKKYSNLESIIDKSVKRFSEDVKNHKFPSCLIYSFFQYYLSR